MFIVVYSKMKQVFFLIQTKQAHVLSSSDALDGFLDLLELEFCSLVFEVYMYLILLRCFIVDNLNIIFLIIHYNLDQDLNDTKCLSHLYENIF